MKVFAAAKVNLGLRVLGRRADGFHELDSLVTLVGLGDEVTLGRAPATTLEIVGDGVAVDALPARAEDNLAVRAARALEREVGRPLPTAIRIAKRIPLGGGLGGGSTDAAAVLRGMDALWGLGLPQERLCAIGAALGSDVPLFLLDGTVRMRGRGERVGRVDMAGAPPLWVVLANCGAHCPTPAVYRAWDRLAGEKTLTNDEGMWDNLGFFLRTGRFEAVARTVGNDLEAPCLGLFPEVARTARALREAGCAGVTLCGSGATVFGLVGSRAEGERALAHPALSGCWRVCTQTLPDGVMAAHGPLTPIVMVRIHVGQPCGV